MTVIQQARSLDQSIAASLAEIERELRPLGVVRIRYSLGEDWSGDPAVFFRVMLNEKQIADGGLGELVNRVRDTLYERLGFGESDYWPYVEVRGLAEQERLRDPKWE